MLQNSSGVHNMHQPIAQNRCHRLLQRGQDLYTAHFLQIKGKFYSSDEFSCYTLIIFAIELMKNTDVMFVVNRVAKKNICKGHSMFPSTFVVQNPLAG